MPLPSNWNERIRAIVERTKSDKVAAREFTYDPPYREFFPSETIASWPDFDRWISELKGSWCLRGQRNAEWLLSTSLDRAVRIEHQTENSSGFYHLPRLPIEQEYLFKFRQQAQNWGLRISLRTALGHLLPELFPEFLLRIRDLSLRLFLLLFLERFLG